MNRFEAVGVVAKNRIRAGHLNTHNFIFYFRSYGGRQMECWQKHKRFIIYYNSLLMSDDTHLARNFFLFRRDVNAYLSGENLG